MFFFLQKPDFNKKKICIVCPSDACIYVKGICMHVRISKAVDYQVLISFSIKYAPAVATYVTISKKKRRLKIQFNICTIVSTYSSYHIATI